ncbi:MAG: helix-turn-helix transcriptional regulator [[Eubacterium] sulci]|nr:helix-turn-helix transcriptional regulator [[Eubacterium] sulci]
MIAFGKSNLTQTEVCSLTGISKSAMSSYLSGRYFPKEHSVKKLAHVFGVSVDYLRGFERDNHE